MAQWSFAIISDIHVFTSGAVPKNFPLVVQGLVEEAPRFVVVSGDATVGNPHDGVSASKARGWWQKFHDALKPLREAGIPVLVIAGNHDYYTTVHQAEYRAAWPALADDFAQVAPLGEEGDAPLYYSVDIDDVHLSLIHVVRQQLEPEVEEWLRNDLAAASGAGLRLAIGHIPLVSMMGESCEPFKNALGAILAEGQVAAYFSGHEHLVWDQELEVPGGTVRQVHVGTASGTYHYPLSKSVYEAHCQKDQGTLPATGVSFGLVPGTRQQRDKVNVCVVDIYDTDFEVRHLTLRDGRLQAFGV
jgi:hypothetical protein